MNFLHSFINVGLGAVGGLLGNLLAAWVLQDAWGNLITLPRLLATAAGFVLVILILAWLDARTQRQATASPNGEIRGNVQIGESIIRVLQGANVLWNLQVGKNKIEVISHRPPTLPAAAQPRRTAPLRPKQKNKQKGKRSR